MGRYIDRHFKSRRGDLQAQVLGIIVGAILFVVLLVILGNLLPTGLGTMANGSTGSKMINVDSGSKGLYNNLNLFAVIVFILIFIGVAIAVLRREGRL